jgi:topoisomerase-4 subunit B
MPKPLYNDDEIEALTGIEAIRRRPDMFLGAPTGAATINILLQESLCISLDNLIIGAASILEIHLHSDGIAVIRDNGPGLPLKTLTCGQTLTEIMFTAIAACRQLKTSAKNSFLCGPGIVCTNALSSRLVVDNSLEGFNWQTQFIKGVAEGPVQNTGPVTSSGLQITLQPDPQFFGECRFCSDEFIKWYSQRDLDLPNDCSIRLHLHDSGVVHTLYPTVRVA